MYLSDASIMEAAENRGLIEPFNPARVNPCSYDVSLGDRFISLREGEGERGVYVSPRETPTGTLEELDRSKERVVLKPGRFLLATTRETVRLPGDLAAQVVGKSSIGRTGLCVQNAGHIDPGFEGKITLELHNSGPFCLDLTDVDAIAQLVFIRTDRPVKTLYNGKYQGQDDVTAARWEKESE